MCPRSSSFHCLSLNGEFRTAFLFLKQHAFPSNATLLIFHFDRSLLCCYRSQFREVHVQSLANRNSFSVSRLTSYQAIIRTTPVWAKATSVIDSPGANSKLPRLAQQNVNGEGIH